MEEQGSFNWLVIAAFAGWAAAARLSDASGLDVVLGSRPFLTRALCEGIAGAGLLLWGARRGRMPRVRAWGSLALLAVLSLFGQLLWRPYIDGVLGVHYVRASLEAMPLLVAPLWLALLAGLRLVPDAVPRRTAGAAFAGLAAYCLLLQGEDLTPRLKEVPALLLCWLWAVATVWAWSYARRMLAGARVAAAAGAGLLCSAGLQGVAAAVMRKDAVPVGWPDIWIPLVSATVMTGVTGWLWYWLLLRVQAAVFSIQTVVLWLSAMVVGLATFGFLSWRVDLTLALGVGAVVTAVQARVENEEPLRLDVAALR